jgi:hypothetical protein
MMQAEAFRQARADFVGRPECFFSTIVALMWRNSVLSDEIPSEESDVFFCEPGIPKLFARFNIPDRPLAKLLEPFRWGWLFSALFSIDCTRRLNSQTAPRFHQFHPQFLLLSLTQ